MLFLRFRHLLTRPLLLHYIVSLIYIHVIVIPDIVRNTISYTMVYFFLDIQIDLRHKYATIKVPFAILCHTTIWYLYIATLLLFTHIQERWDDKSAEIKHPSNFACGITVNIYTIITLSTRTTKTD